MEPSELSKAAKLLDRIRARRARMAAKMAEAEAQERAAAAKVRELAWEEQEL
jgi:hypothetical protein